jgi:hypothetical protein
MAESYKNVNKTMLFIFKFFQTFFFLFEIIRLQEIFEKKFEGWEISRKSSIWIYPGTTGSFWIQSFQIEIRISDIRRLSKKKRWEIIKKSSIWISLAQAQLVRFGFRMSKHFLFFLIWDYKTSGDLQKYFVN